MGNFGLACKEKMVREYVERLKESSAVFVASFQGIQSSDIETLRRTIKKGGSSDMVIVKNSLLKRALKAPEIDSEMRKMESYFAGSCVMALAKDDPAAAAKALFAFAKGKEGLKVQGGFLDGGLMAADKVKELSALPSRETLIAMAVRGIKSPLSGFVGVLGGVPRSLVHAVKAIKNKKGENG